MKHYYLMYKKWKYKYNKVFNKFGMDRNRKQKWCMISIFRSCINRNVSLVKLNKKKL